MIVAKTFLSCLYLYARAKMGTCYRLVLILVEFIAIDLACAWILVFVVMCAVAYFFGVFMYIYIYIYRGCVV